MRLGLSADDLTLFFGEDYELLFTVKPDTPDQILTDISNKSKVKITEIGRIKSSQPNITLIKNGFRKSIQNKGWDHFKKTGE
jgi:thiamine monophosphate kinase